MADVFSVIASGVGIADVALRLIKYLRDVKKAAENIEDDIDLLITEVEALEAVHGELQRLLEKNVEDKNISPKETTLWFQTAKTLKAGQILSQKLEVCVREIYDDDPKVKGKRDALVKQHRKRSRDATLSDFRDQVHSYQGALQLWMSIISLLEL